MAVFCYHPDVIAQFPDLVGGVILAEGMRNALTPEGLLKRFVAEQTAVAARVGDRLLSELEPLAAWRRAFRQFGTDPTKYRSAPEALLRRLTKKETIPSINALVDIGNLASIRYALPIAVFDTRTIQGTVTVRFASGVERYIELGQSEVLHPEPGEVIFADEANTVVARRWCWRQSAGSAATLETTNAIITVEAQHPGGRSDVESALADVTELLREYAGGGYKQAILDRSSSSV